MRDAVDFIAELRPASDPAALPIGRRVVVIGGGMTAVDAAVQSKLLGAEDVHMVYRRGPEHMSASAAEQHWAQTNGVTIHYHLAPVAIEGDGGWSRGRGALRDKIGAGEEAFAADMVLKAIGQKLDDGVLAGAGLALEGGRIVADGDGRTTSPGSGPAATVAPAAATSPSKRSRTASAPRGRSMPRSAPAPAPPPRPPSEGADPWLTCAPPSSASPARIRSGWPRRRRPTRPTTSTAPSRPAGAAWSGRRSARTRRSSTSTARATARCSRHDRRMLGFNNIELITDRPLQINLDEIARGQARLARPRAGRLADGAVRRRARGRRSCRGSRTPAPTASSSTSAARTA